MEIGQLKDVDRYLNIIFPDTGLDKPLILCSDNHKATEYVASMPLWLRADPTFCGLQMVLREPRDRVFIGGRPSQMSRVEQNRTKYVRGISFQRKEDAPPTEKWFSGNIQFNHGLVAIVGNKGSGKSALSDMVGLLGATKNTDAFSFLCKERFRHPVGGLAKFFEATLEWESGDTITKCLADRIKPEEIERLKYLPQNHVEKVCNELANIEEAGFEQELKSVIFSHVPEAERLGCATLDELVRFQTGEKQKRIDTLLKQLREVSRRRAILEAKVDPAAKNELLERIKRREMELLDHDKVKPAVVSDPAAKAATTAIDAKLLKDLAAEVATKKRLDDDITKTGDALRIAERRHAVAKKLLEKLGNFEKEFNVFKDSLNEDVVELDLVADDLLSLRIELTKPTKKYEEAATCIANAKQQLNAIDPPGLLKQLENTEAMIVDLQSKLDAPNRNYQNYCKALSEWDAKRVMIEGNDKEPESLKGLRSALAAYGLLPGEVIKAKEEQVELALQIHGEVLAQVEVYRTLYSAVQRFIESHVLAKDKFKLEFRAELMNENFGVRLMALLALNRRGSFMGVDEGRALVENLVQSTKWEEVESVRKFLCDVDEALHIDKREGQGGAVQLKDQLLKGRKPEEVLDLLYGLEYLRPRYVLRWDGKDLSMLSPGERGTLLLVFYLLIDKSDLPLVIDQPEGNLDNHTVAKVLVDCIKEARKKRQVFIVTHNPNLAVVCDADQIIHANMDKAGGNVITYTSGALENPDMCEYVTDVLEGTRWAFGVRGLKYEVGDKNG
jgi:ABC-type lipoprotein export system ATPase subunit